MVKYPGGLISPGDAAKLCGLTRMGVVYNLEKGRWPMAGPLPGDPPTRKYVIVSDLMKRLAFEKDMNYASVQ